MLGPYAREVAQRDGTAFNYLVHYEYYKWYRSEKPPYKAPLPYLHYKSFWSDAKPNAFLNHPCNAACGGAYLGTGAGGFTTPCPELGNMVEVHNKAYARFVNKVSTGLNLGVSLAELGQTRALIGSLLNGLRKPVVVLASAFNRYAKKTGKPKSWIAKNVALRDIPGAWLAFHFGVEPLVNDLYSAFDAYLLKNPDMFYSSSSKGKWNVAVGPKPSTYDYYDTRYEFDAVARLAGSVRFKESNMASLANVGLINPLSIAWELIPYSFVVDWFYPVGRLIDSMTDLYHVEVTDCYQSWLLKCKSKYRYADGIYANQWRNNQAMRFERKLVAPKFYAPPFRVPGQWSKARLATAASLVLNAFYPTAVKVK